MRIRKKRFRRAQFRDAYFYIESHDFETGRRVSLTEFPYRDNPFTEDLGRKAKHMNIRAFMLGANYQEARDKLIAACEAYGAGKLVHPYFGTLTVNCISCRTFETTLEGGLVHFDLSFVEAIEVPSPSVSVDPKSDFQKTLDSTVEKVGKYYQDALDKVDWTSSMVETMSDTLFAASDAIENQFSHLMRLTDSIDTFGRAIIDFKSTVNYLAVEPRRTWGKFTGLWDVITQAAEPRSLVNLFGPILTAPVVVTVPGVSQQVSEVKISHQILAVANLARILPNVQFDTYDHGIEIQALFAKAILSLLEAIQDDDLFLALQDLKAKTLVTLSLSTSKLKHVSQIRLSQMESSLSLSYDLYGDLDHEADLIQRNQITHPAYFPAHQPLEVITP